MTAKRLSSSPGIGGLINVIKARWDIGRHDMRIEPGLYVIDADSASPNSPVFVTSNYSLTVDTVRKALAGVHGDGGAAPLLLVLDTDGVNVWCAAGKGSFGTDELVRRIEVTELAKVVSHRELILPQLGATGVSGHEVKRRTGFHVRWGPVEAHDIGAFMAAGQHAAREMRRVEFGLMKRMALIPVEAVQFFVHFMLLTIVIGVFVGPLSGIAMASTFVGGVVIFPLAIFALPGRTFTTKGLVLGACSAAIQVAIGMWTGMVRGGRTSDIIAWPFALIGSAIVIAFIALNFSGATTFSSKSETLKEAVSWLSVVPVLEARARQFYRLDFSLEVDKERCIGCAACTQVCPHEVLEVEQVAAGKRTIRIAKPQSCMECGACAKNCPHDAIRVEAGVGCAYAIIASAIAGKKVISCDSF